MLIYVELLRIKMSSIGSDYNNINVCKDFILTVRAKSRIDSLVITHSRVSHIKSEKSNGNEDK